MIRSMWTAASGMIAQQNNIDNISNNLANANTTGYKKTNTEFQSLLYANMASTNRMNADGQSLPVNFQLGLGVKVAGIRPDYKQGNLQQTNNPLDLALTEKGFFEIRMPDGSLAYTRDGQFKITNAGKIVNSNGYELGIATGEEFSVDDINNFNVANNGAITMKNTSSLKVDIFIPDTTGAFNEIADAPGFFEGDFEQWEAGDPPNDIPPADRYYQVEMPNGDEAYVKADNFTVDDEGNIVTLIKAADDEGIMKPAILVTGDPPEVDDKTYEIGIDRNGNFEITKEVGKINVVSFINPEGLERIGENLFRPTSASGGPVDVDSENIVRSGFIEGSNVEVAEEMVKMIMAQRVYELNSKAITTADDMMGIANNLKR